MLARHEGAAKLIAGGQSLMPMLNFRLLAPDVLVDISRLPGLEHIAVHATGLEIGAGVRHCNLMTSPVVVARFPVLAYAMSHVAHRAIRNRGTIGGSLAHGDAAAELPFLMALLGAELAIISPKGERRIAAASFFLAPLTTDLADDEMIVAVHVPYLPDGAGWGFHEVARRSGDFALAGAAAILTMRGDVIAEARLAVLGVDETSRRLPAIEALLIGQAWDESARAAVIQQTRADVHPTSDLQASADYRRHLAGVMAARALDDAWRRAQGGGQ